MGLSIEQKEMIINKYKLNITISKISQDMNISRTAIHFWIKRYKEKQSLDRKYGSGVRIIDQNKIQR